MKRILSIGFQIFIVLFGIAVFVFMLWEPHLEGRNAHATPFQIYFNDPFLAYAYIGSIPFFVSLYYAFRALGYVRQHKVFSHEAAKALRAIKYCTMTLIGFVVVGEIFILLSESDDRAGGVFIGLLVIFGSMVMAAAATMLERRLQKTL